MPRYPATKAPPSCENISIELAKQVLAELWGNIAQAADALGVPSRDFRFLVRTMPELTAVADEAGELYCDKAESILRDALESENDLRRDVAARFVLSGKGAMRGWTRPLSSAVTIEQPPPRPIVIKWLGEDERSREVSDGSPALIDGGPVEGDDRSSEQTLQRSSSPEDVGDLGQRPFAAARGRDTAGVQDISNVGQALPLGTTQRASQRGYAALASAASLEASHEQARTIVIKWGGGGSDREMDVIERDGKNISVPRYSRGRGDDCVEDEAATPAVLIEHQDAIVPQPVASMPVAPTPMLPVWSGPYPPPPLVAHLYAPFTPASRVALAHRAARPSTLCAASHRARLRD
jgi:hypothetical protein